MQVPFRPELFFALALIIVALIALVLIITTLASRSAYERRDQRRRRRKIQLQDFIAELQEMNEAGRSVALGRAVRRLRFEDRLTLIRLVDEIDEPERSELLGYLSSQAGKRSLRWTSKHAHDRWQRVGALELMSALDLPESQEALIEALDDRDGEVRYAAVLQLVRKTDKEAAEAVADLFGTDKINSKRLAAVLEGSKVPVVDVLRSRLDDENPQTRFWAVTVLGFSTDVGLLPVLARYASDEDPSVRSAALQSIARIGTAAARPLLADSFKDETWFVRGQAAKAAGQLRADEYLRDLLELLGDQNWWVRQNARVAIERLGKNAHARLIRYLDTDDRFAQNMVVEALENTGAVDDIFRNLSGDETAVRNAEATLARIASAGGEHLLASVAQQSPEPRRQRLLAIIEQYGAGSNQAGSEGDA